MTRPIVMAAIAKDGHNVLNAEPKDMILTSQADSLKILATGSLSISLPNETLTSQTKTYTASYTHSLGYIPFFFPHAINTLNQDEPTDSNVEFNINESNQVALPAGAFSPALAAEFADIYTTTTELVLRITRYEEAGSPADFGAHNATLNFTLFYNKINETFNFI